MHPGLQGNSVRDWELMGFFSARGGAEVAPSHGNRSPAGYAKHKADAAARQRRQSEDGREIGPIPPVADPERRARCLASLEVFGRTYFPDRFNLPLSTFHRGYIADLERIIRFGGKLAVAMPRSSGKSSWAEVAVLWAICRGDHNYVLLVAATQPAARKQLSTLRTLLTKRALMAEDFPEICHPLQEHGGVNQRRPLLDGRPLTVRITAEMILFPNVPDSTSSEAIIECIGLGGAIRGRAFEREDGTKARPTLVIADDPQTKKTAKSLKLTDERESLLKADVNGLPPPDRSISVIIPCTVIYPNDLADRLLDREKNPAYNGRREKLLNRMPDDTELWARFREVRADGLRNGDGGAAGTEFYRAFREAMDRGAEPTWLERFEPHQISATQYAMEIYCDDRQVFFSEYQNDPAGATDDDFGLLDPDDLVRRSHGLPRGRLPHGTEYLAVGLDVHGDLLYWTAIAAPQAPTLAVVGYDTFPRQVLQSFSKRGAPRKIANIPELKNLDADDQLGAALEMCVAEIFAETFVRENGERLTVGKVVVDCRWRTDVVTAWARRSQFADRILCVMGSKDSNDFGRRPPPGSREGPDYYVPPLSKWPCRVGSADSNAWISRVHAGFQAPLGASGAWTLFAGESELTHQNYAEHITAELPSDFIDKRTGRTFRKWTPRPGGPDNHWLDATKMAALGCFDLGCTLNYAVVPQVQYVEGDYYDAEE